MRRTSFDLAVEYDDPLIAKNCLFLLSEVAVRYAATPSAPDATSRN
jgi:hypothetical protein